MGFKSLNPEFDEANAAILAALDADPSVAFVCDECGQEFVYDSKWIGTMCTEEDCMGTLQVIKGENEVINLPDAIKNGTSYQSGSSGGSSNYHGAGGGSNTYIACKHYGKKIIFEQNGKQLFGSNNSSIDEWSGFWDLIIDLAGVVVIPNVVPFVASTAPKRFRALDKLVGKEKELPSEILRLYWNDMSVPPVGLKFWRELWDLLPEKTVIACQGGHGRTGTCLAAFMIIRGIDYYSAVETVRTEHCHKAIETVSQEKYLHNLYVEILEEELKAATDKDTAADIEADILYAKENAPSSSTSSASKNWGWQSGTMAGGNVDKDKKPSVTVHYPPGQKRANVTPGTALADAISTMRAVKTIDGAIFIEECIQSNCLVVGCNQASHQAWKDWDSSMTKVEYSINALVLPE